MAGFALKISLAQTSALQHKVSACVGPRADAKRARKEAVEHAKPERREQRSECKGWGEEGAAV